MPASAASHDRVGRERRRHVDHRRVGAGGVDRFGNRVEHGPPSTGCSVPPLPGGHAGHHLGAVGAAEFAVEAPPALPVKPCTMTLV